MDKKQQVTDCFQVVKDGKRGKRVPSRGKSAVHTKGRSTKREPEETPAEQQTEINKMQRFTRSLRAAPGEFPGLSPLEKLREFDLNWHFGPCSGITRLERWQRAHELKLSPPEIIRQILLNHASDPTYQYSLWHAYNL